LLAGLALDLIFSKLKPAALRASLLFALTLPGIYAIIELHPYQYVYYNSFAGGVRGAFRKFELDYWCTSYREAALWLNKNAAANAKIEGDGPAYLLSIYLRPDLSPLHESKSEEQYDYLVTTNRYNQDLTLFPEARVVYSIERDHAVLAVIKQLSP
jgi:hypothetical protein